ncbi:mechanosensitive ion channel [bacterium]|nr:mechanosensitive ion channel [candidate division CSSED10-310 bacterium]
MKETELFAKVQEWLVTKGVGFVIDLAVFLLILLVGGFVIRAICKVIQRLLHRAKRVSEMLEKFVVSVTGKVLWVVLLMVALPRLGIDIAPLIAGLGVTGFIVGFAFQESLGNLAAGLMLLLNAPFKIGDYIEAAGHAGTVRELNLMATTMTTPDNKLVVIPNRSIWGGSIVNYSSLDTRRVDLEVGIAYGSSIAKAKAALAKVVEADNRILAEPAPMIEVVAMADSSVNLVVRPWVRTTDYWDVYFALNRAIKETLDSEGIEIPFPQIDVHHHGMTS